MNSYREVQSVPTQEPLRRALPGNGTEVSLEALLFSGAHPPAPRPTSLALELWRERGSDLSSAARLAMSQLEEAARSDEPLLLIGEPFCGKRDCALAVHQSGARAQRPFVEWKESGGGPTTVTRALEMAEGGTLYLGDMGRLTVEAREQWVLELQTRASPRSVRVVAAAHPNDAASSLALLVDGHAVEIPPLRRRKSDLPVLVERYLTARSRLLGRRVPSLSAGALKALREYGWPGNFLELEACLDWASLASPSNAEIQLWDLPPAVRGGSASGRSTRLSEMVSAVERRAIIEALGQNGNKKIHAAAALGISRPTLDKKIAQYQIQLKRSAV